MRDFERWKDRVEISLEGRQIFFLFFGTAVAACLIFVAGVYVGRRIEQRNAPPPAAEDPLAALDQLEEEPDDGLTFHETLVHEKARDRRVERPDHPTAATPDVRPRPAGHFTLQLSSFANPGDADAFVRKLRSLGLKPQVVRSDVPGKGTVYRVRLGDYATRQAADQARSDYEKKQRGGALVVPL